MLARATYGAIAAGLSGKNILHGAVDGLAGTPLFARWSGRAAGFCAAITWSRRSRRRRRRVSLTSAKRSASSRWSRRSCPASAPVSAPRSARPTRSPMASRSPGVDRGSARLHSGRSDAQAAFDTGTSSSGKTARPIAADRRAQSPSARSGAGRIRHRRRDRARQEPAGFDRQGCRVAAPVPVLADIPTSPARALNGETSATPR